MSIAVAIDGRSAGWEALSWAAQEASARGCPLRIVHVFRWPPFTLDAYGHVLVREWYSDAYDAALALVDYAGDRAREISPTLQIVTQVEAGGVVDSVLRTLGCDELLVIGRHRPVGRLRPTPWSLSWQFARRSSAPVVLVASAAQAARLAAPSTEKVVVVVDDLDNGYAAVNFALATARRWGTGVTAVVVGGPRRIQAEGTIREWSKSFPEVDVRQRVVAGRYASELAEEARGAALVVAGGRRLGRLHSAFIGSADGQVVRETDGPIAFVRADTQRLAPLQPRRSP